MPKPPSQDPWTVERRRIFGRNVRRLREERGLSQEALAEASGLERKAVQRIETATFVPSLDRVLELADGLGLPPAELFVGMVGEDDGDA